MHSVELVNLTGANFESAVYKPGSVVQFKRIEVLNVAINQYAFRIFFAVENTKLLETIRCIEMTVVCGNSGLGCRLVTTVWISRYRRPGRKRQLGPAPIEN